MKRLGVFGVLGFAVLCGACGGAPDPIIDQNVAAKDPAAQVDPGPDAGSPGDEAAAPEAAAVQADAGSPEASPSEEAAAPEAAPAVDAGAPAVDAAPGFDAGTPNADNCGCVFPLAPGAVCCYATDPQLQKIDLGPGGPGQLCIIDGDGVCPSLQVLVPAPKCPALAKGAKAIVDGLLCEGQ